MQRQFTLEYWIDDGWYVGKLKEVHGVFTQGETLNDLEENIKDAYALVMEEELQSDRTHVISALPQVGQPVRARTRECPCGSDA